MDLFIHLPCRPHSLPLSLIFPLLIWRHIYILAIYGTEAEIRLPLKRFPKSSVSPLIRTGWCGMHPTTTRSNTHGDFSTSGRVKSCKVSLEVWLSIRGKRPTLVKLGRKRRRLKIKDDDDECSE